MCGRFIKIPDEDIKRFSFNEAKPPKRDTKDVTSKIIGDFGKWQLRISILMAVLKFPIAWYQLNIIFMAPPQDFWCKKPAIFTKYSEEEWRKICCPVSRLYSNILYY